MKKGYTLAETLIALSLIGIITAITAPLASKFVPDTNKIAFLRTYDSVNQAIEYLYSNEQIYPINNAGDNIDYTTYPFYNITAVILDNVQYSADNAKFCKLLAMAFNGENTNCSSAFPINTYDAATRSFVSRNGTEFWVQTDRRENNGNAYYESIINFDIDGISKGRNCTYNANNCPRPDRFTLHIMSDGMVIVDNALENDYILKRNNWRLNRDSEPAAYDPTALITANIEKPLIQFNPED